MKFNELNNLSIRWYRQRRDDLEGYTAIGSWWSQCLATTVPLEGEIIVGFSDLWTGSDYGGSGALGKANERDLRALLEGAGLEEGEAYWTVAGPHSTYGIAIRADLELPESVEAALKGLANYPIIDEGTLCEVEMEEQEEAWTGWVAYEFARELEKAGIEGPAGNDELRTLFETMREAAGEEWTSDGSSGAHIRVENIVAKGAHGVE